MADDLKKIQEAIKKLKKKELDVKRKTKEYFNVKKFLAGINIFNPLMWVKTLVYSFRQLIIIAVIIGLIFGMGRWSGKKDKPVILGYKDFTAYIDNGSGREHKLEVKGGRLYFDNKVVKVRDVPGLRPYGIRIRPKLFAGLGFDGGEVGLGAEVAHLYKLNLDIFGTNKAFYAGVSYDIDIEGWVQNSSTGIALGKSWDMLDTRALWYWSWKF